MSTIERFLNWIRSSITLKLVTITILVLVLLIPASMIRSIIQEREWLNSQATNEVTSKWANSQELLGPILTIPLVYEKVSDNKTYQTTRYFHMLPETLDIVGTVDPEKLKRGIYEVVVYKSELKISGSFDLDLTVDQSDLVEIKYQDAFLTFGISDLRGIEDEIQFAWGGQTLEAQPGTHFSDEIYSGLTIDLPDLESSEDQQIPFSFDLNLQGSHDMSFIPIGSITNVSLKSDWPDPSFNGNFLPDNRTVSETGFEASWKILQLNRNFPQTWTGNTNFSKLSNSTFGVNLILPLDDYQKSIRSAKYAVMSIALTFLIFFLVEVLSGRKIHPFQYTLVGLALCLFYVLLISISEHAGFNNAYFVSALAIIGMISLYSLSVFKKRKHTLLLAGTLTGIYGFLFVILQMADYALLFGSLGLTLILATTMYFTRKINWYDIMRSEE